MTGETGRRFISRSSVGGSLFPLPPEASDRLGEHGWVVELVSEVIDETPDRLGPPLLAMVSHRVEMGLEVRRDGRVALRLEGASGVWLRRDDLVALASALAAASGDREGAWLTEDGASRQLRLVDEALGLYALDDS